MSDATNRAARKPEKAHVVPELLCFVGIAAVAVGLWLLHPSAALIVIGLLVALAGVGLYRSRSVEETPR